MADPNKRLPLNVAGDFFVDSTCIDCDTCRQLAPQTFEDSGEFSFVFSQPENEDLRRSALRALLSCPTGSIGASDKHDLNEVMEDFPLLIEDDVYYCGFNSPKSYGGNSYFIVHKDGNWLIDSPKYLPHLVSRFAQMGGIRYIFLTHRDDVAEAEKYAKRFSSQRIIHEEGLSAQPNAEVVLRGQDDNYFAPDILIIPTPGHTRCHCVLLYKNRFLFAGDHLSWDRRRNTLRAFKRVCWYSWAEQTESMKKLTNISFEWVLPGHGQRVKAAADEMQRHLTKLIEYMSLE